MFSSVYIVGLAIGTDLYAGWLNFLNKMIYWLIEAIQFRLFHLNIIFISISIVAFMSNYYLSVLKLTRIK